MYKVQLAEEHEGCLVLQASLNVRYLPAIGDQAINDTLHPTTGKPVKVFAKVTKVILRPAQNPAVDAIIVMEVLRVALMAQPTPDASVDGNHDTRRT